MSVQLDGALNATNVATSSGDALLDAADRYVVGELDTGVGLGVVYAGAGATRLPDASATNGAAVSTTWRRLVVPAGGRVIVMGFAVQKATRADAITEADALMNLTNASATSDLAPRGKDRHRQLHRPVMTAMTSQRAIATLLTILCAIAGAAMAASPVAVIDGATTFENLAVTIDVLGNDTDADGDPLSVTTATAGTNGTTVVNGDNTITYTPNPGFTGGDSFTYTTSDGSSTDVGTVNVTVWGDAVPPTVTAALSVVPNASGWHAGAVTVSFTCDDLESGVASCSAAASVTTEGESIATGTATDNAGNSANLDVTVKLDTAAPTVSVSAPTASRRGGSAELTATPADTGSGIDYVRFTIDGAAAPDVTAAPFTYTLNVPESAAAGSTIAVDSFTS